MPDLNERLITALQAIVDLEGKVLSTSRPEGDYRRGFRIGSHFAFEKAARIARSALRDAGAGK